MTPQQLIRFQKIIDVKEWRENPLHESVEKKLFNLMNKLNENEINLVLELLNNFTWIGNNQYDKKILDIFRKIDSSIISSATKFYFFPVVKPWDSYKLKSGLSLIYPVVGIINYIEELDHIEKGSNCIITNYKTLSKLKLKDTEYLILVDDFIGSGKTFKSCIEQIESYSIPLEKIILISIAIQNEGLEIITNKKIKAYYSHIERKGITDFYYADEQTKRKSLMKLIERKLKFNSKFSLGYEESEALLSLIKTPNNTFPIFWHEYYDHNLVKKAPFPRY
ncbi:MAG: hypothetical protein ACN6OJ_00310 [Chryseobacterium sp.]|uniref:phosphoribosyltransferase-like protein n=1 Tax=Chryseobacterium sp. TaxID=1871047 RepID=UPI003D0A9787